MVHSRLLLFGVLFKHKKKESVKMSHSVCRHQPLPLSSSPPPPSSQILGVGVLRPTSSKFCSVASCLTFPLQLAVGVFFSFNARLRIPRLCVYRRGEVGFLLRPFTFAHAPRLTQLSLSSSGCLSTPSFALCKLLSIACPPTPHSPLTLTVLCSIQSYVKV
jgi:hypothetical protein